MSQDFFYPPGSSSTVVIPPGGATAANQVLEIAQLTAINSNTTGVSTAAKQDTGNSSLASIDGKLNSLGQKAMAASVPVVIASDQSTIAVSAASLPLPSGAATSALQTALNDKSASAFINSPFDETVITYVGATTDISTVVYKLASVTVNTLTMTYDGSNRLVDVVKT